MVVFQEWFPIKQKLITADVKVQEKNESPEKATDKDKIVFPLQPIYEVPRKKSMIKFIEEAKDDTAKCMKESKIVDAKMAEIQRMIENFDMTDFFITPTESVRSFNGNEIEVACSESILSFKGGKELQIPTDGSVVSFYKRTIKNNPKICPQKKFKKPEVALVQKKSRFTLSSTTQKKLLPKSLSLNNLSTTKNLIPKLSLFKKAEPQTKKPLISTPSPSVQRILQEAKNKRKKSQTEIPIPVVNLKFL